MTFFIQSLRTTWNKFAGDSELLSVGGWVIIKGKVEIDDGIGPQCPWTELPSPSRCHAREEDSWAAHM